VEVVRIPAIFRDSWIPGARAFYTAQFLGVLDRTHKALFEAIHLNKQRFPDAQSFAKFFAKFGVAEKDFLDTYNSFAVDAKVRRAQDLTRRYQIDGVPTLVINGKYRTTGTIANGHDGMLEVLEFVIKQESAGK
jgi:thiol:disulfide interchange protein DsbA